MTGDHWLLWICVHKDIHGISQQQNLQKRFPFPFGNSIFRNLKVIMMHTQQGIVLGRLGFRANPSELASIFYWVCRLGLKISRHWVVVTSNFSFRIVSSWGFWSLNSTSFFSSVRRGEFTSVRFVMNFPKYESCLRIAGVH